MRYRLYGLSLGSPVPLPGLRTGSRRVDVRFVAAPAATFPAIRTRPRDWFHYRRTAAGWSHLRWDRLFEFLVSPDGRAIRYRRLAAASLESFTTYLLGQVLSFSLLAQGQEPLHGTAVAVDGGAVGFLGDCGAGKSTLGAAMLARGFPLVTDDLMVLDRDAGGYQVHPGPARIKLYPRSARLLPGARSGAAMVPGIRKRVFPLGPAESVAQAVPLRALYVIETPRRPAGVDVAPLRGGAAFRDVVRAAFNVVVTDRDRLANQFRFATHLALRVPLRRLRYPRSLASLGPVCDAVLADLRP